MKGWIVRGKGDPWDVYEWDELPEPTHEAMQRLSVDLAGLRTRGEGDAPCSSYLFVRVLAAGLATPDVTMATGEYPVPIEPKMSPQNNDPVSSIFVPRSFGIGIGGQHLHHNSRSRSAPEDSDYSA